jgi:hypothetical protein
VPDNEDKTPPIKSIPIIDFLAILTGTKPRKLDGKKRLQPEPVRPLRLHEQPIPLTPSERVHFGRVPLDACGAPHCRSQLAAFEAGEANIDAGRMNLFSFDDDINALHFIARYERAGLGRLADGHRKRLAAYRAEEAAHGKPFQKLNPYLVATYDSEELMLRMYGTPDEDRGRIIQFHRRCAEINAAESKGLPSRYSSAEPV